MVEFIAKIFTNNCIFWIEGLQKKHVHVPFQNIISHVFHSFIYFTDDHYKIYILKNE